MNDLYLSSELYNLLYKIGFRIENDLDKTNKDINISYLEIIEWFEKYLDIKVSITLEDVKLFTYKKVFKIYDIQNKLIYTSNKHDANAIFYKKIIMRLIVIAKKNMPCVFSYLSRNFKTKCKLTRTFGLIETEQRKLKYLFLAGKIKDEHDFLREACKRVIENNKESDIEMTFLVNCIKDHSEEAKVKSFLEERDSKLAQKIEDLFFKKKLKKHQILLSIKKEQNLYTDSFLIEKIEQYAKI